MLHTDCKLVTILGVKLSAQEYFVNFFRLPVEVRGFKLCAESFRDLLCYEKRHKGFWPGCGQTSLSGMAKLYLLLHLPSHSPAEFIQAYSFEINEQSFVCTNRMQELLSACMYWSYIKPQNLRGDSGCCWQYYWIKVESWGEKIVSECRWNNRAYAMMWTVSDSTIREVRPCSY